jgi:hypothetical protein
MAFPLHRVDQAYNGSLGQAPSRVFSCGAKAGSLGHNPLAWSSRGRWTCRSRTQLHKRDQSRLLLRAVAAPEAPPKFTAGEDEIPQVCVVLGTQWGDEGKGKLVDILARQYDIVARAQVCPASSVDYRVCSLVCYPEVCSFLARSCLIPAVLVFPPEFPACNLCKILLACIQEGRRASRRGG